MKSFAVAALLACLALPSAGHATTQQAQAAQPVDQAKLAEARAIIAVIFPPAERQQMMDKMLDDISAPLRQSMPATMMQDAGLKAILDDFLDKAQARQRPLLHKNMPIMLDAMASAYTRMFTLTELQDVHRFALSPSGRSYLSKSLAIMGDPAVAEANKAIIGESMALGQEMLPDLRKKLTDYIEAHPEVAEKIAAQAKQ